MNMFEKFIYLLQTKMIRPELFGWFHLLCIFITGLSVFLLYKRKDKYNEKQLKKVLGVYGFIAFILELLKQVSWSFNYNSLTNTVTWDYQWYAFPFQLCTTPIYVSIICFFMKKNKIRDALLSYLAYVTILGSLATIIYPTSCFVEDILVNIHTMYLHCGSLVLSLYLIFSKEVKLNKESIKSGVYVFICFVFLALIMNIVVYNLNICNNETFNMFYISPYFIGVLPVFDLVQQLVPYPVFLLFYIVMLISGSYLVYLIAKILSKKRI